MRNNNQPSGLAKLLTALLITCAVVETGIASHVGVTVQSNQEANARSAAQYEAYQERQEQVKENPPPVRYVGPEVQVSNGELVKGAWEPTYISEPTAVVQTPTSALPPAVEPVDPEPVQPETPPAEPVAPVTPPKATASTPKADVGSKKAADVPKPSSSGGQSGSQTKAVSKPDSSLSASKPVEPEKTISSNSNKINGSSGTNKTSTTNNISDSTTVYVSNRSNTIHSISNCSNMKNYREMTRSEADSNGYKYCKNCW